MVETSAADVHPPYLYPDYKSTRLRAPAQPLVRVAPSPLEAVSPAFPQNFVRESEADLTTWGTSAPLGEKMVLVGRVLDEDGGYRWNGCWSVSRTILAALATPRERPDRAPPYAPVPDISHAAAIGASESSGQVAPCAARNPSTARSSALCLGAER